MRTRLKRGGVALALSVSLALAVAAAAPEGALAAGSAEACAEFSGYELSRLFEEVGSVEDCEFIMRDYGTGEDVYLKVRDQYRSRYDGLVGADSVRPLSEGGEEPGAEGNVIPGMPLEQVSFPGYGTWSPWRDVLSLQVYFCDDELRSCSRYLGSAFLVSESVAVTAAHCVMDDGAFADYCLAESSVDTQWYGHSPQLASKVVVQKEWFYEDSQLIYDHDFAILIFDEPVQGSSRSGDFSYAGMTAAESLLYSVNCAGYLLDYGGSSGVHLWKNERDGSIPALENLPVSGNDFAVNLSIVQGMSGGPVYRVENGKCVAVGIISHVNKTAGLSYACRITERLQVLIAWADDGGYGNTGSSSGGSGLPSGPGGRVSPASKGVPPGGAADLGLRHRRGHARRDAGPRDPRRGVGRGVGAVRRHGQLVQLVGPQVHPRRVHLRLRPQPLPGKPRPSQHGPRERGRRGRRRRGGGGAL